MNRKTKHVARFLFTWVSNILLKATLNIFGTKIKCHMDNTHCEKLVLAITHWYYQSILYIGDKLCVLFLSCRSLFQPKNTPSCSDIMPTQSFEVQPVWAMVNRDIVWENLPVKLFPDFWDIDYRAARVENRRRYTFRYDSRSHDTHQDLKGALSRRFCCVFVKTANKKIDWQPLTAPWGKYDMISLRKNKL